MVRFRPSIVVWAIVSITVLVVYKKYYLSCFNQITFQNPVRNKNENLSTCVLPKFDSWDPSLMKYTNLKAVEQYKCRNFRMLSGLRDRKLITLSNKHSCKGRCLTRIDEHLNRQGKWKEDGERFDCEIVEAVCFRKGNSTVVYNVFHTQVIPIKEDHQSNKNEKQYDVFVLLIDSIGASQADRNIPKTMRYLEKSMQSVTFPYLNKIGINSKPNGFALWFGKQLETVDRTVFGMPSIPVDWSENQSCFERLDNYTSIFSIFRDQGYRTFLADDWSSSIATWPYCRGFFVSPVDHHMQAFQTPFDDLKNELIRQKYSNKSCNTMLHDIFRYHRQFLRAYEKDTPKFSFLWASEFSHDDYSKSIRWDTEILDFLATHRKEFDESFVILMGDHGFRGNELSMLKLGQLDNNNPFLTIALPKELRNSELAQTMRKNSESLQTHYDVRATLLDIASFQPLTNFTSFSNLQIPEEKGQSLLREQNGERSCRTLPIPYQYCICDIKEEKAFPNSAESKEIGFGIIAHINYILTSNKLLAKCKRWIFSKVISISKFQVAFSNSFTVVVSVSGPYDKAKFKTVVNKGLNGLEIGMIDRLDTFGDRGNCVPGNYMHLCECKNQASSTVSNV